MRFMVVAASGKHDTLSRPRIVRCAGLLHGRTSERIDLLLPIKLDFGLEKKSIQGGHCRVQLNLHGVQMHSSHWNHAIFDAHIP